VSHRATVSVTLMLLSLAGCASREMRTPEPDLRLAVDTRDPILQLPIYVAVHQRMFVSERLRLTLAEFPDETKTSEALSSGACQLASSGFEQVLQAGAKGQSLTGIALLSRSPMLSLIAGMRPRKQRGLPRDIESIAVVAAGDPTDLFARYASRVVTEPKGSKAAVLTAFEQRATGAAVVDAGTLQILDAQSIPYTLLADTRTLTGLIGVYGVSTYPASCVYTSVSWLGAHKDQARRIGKALTGALAYIRNHRTEELLPMLPEAYRSAAVVEQARPLFSQDGIFPGDAAEAVRKVLAASIPSFRKTTVPATAYTNDYVSRVPK
jgi:NitT/TauT family transport system substrate-binding protein